MRKRFYPYKPTGRVMLTGNPRGPKGRANGLELPLGAGLTYEHQTCLSKLGSPGLEPRCPPERRPSGQCILAFAMEGLGSALRSESIPQNVICHPEPATEPVTPPGNWGGP